jgi:hypothetical protein
VLAALGNAMSILGEAMVLVAIPATGGYEARRMLLLAGEQTGRINDSSIHGGRARDQGDARAQNHNQEENNKHRVTEVFFHKKLHVGRT